MRVEIRPERAEDFRTVEELTRDAFWNVYVPGAQEHFVLHQLRKSPAFMPELDLVAEKAGQIVGHIIYTRARLKGEAGEYEILTFGPVSVDPAWQGQGLGAALIEYSLQRAADLGHKGVVIYGHPDYYRRFGFENSRRFGISAADGRYMKALLAREFFPGALQGIAGRFFEDAAFQTDPQAFAAFEETFPPKEKKATESQKEFTEMSQAPA